MRTRRFVTAAAALVAMWILGLAPLSAHPVPFSYLDVRLTSEAIDGAVVLHIFDVAHDLDVTPIERLLDSEFVKTREQAITRLVQARLRLTVNGQPLATIWAGVEVLAERQSLRVRVRQALNRPAAEFNQDFLAWAQAELKAGKTPEQAAAGWKLPEKYQGYSPNAPTMFGGMAGRLQLLAEEMKKK